MKEVLLNPDKSASFVILNQKQLREAFLYATNAFLAKKKTVVLIGLSISPADILAVVPPLLAQNLFIIDCFLGQEMQIENIIKANGPGELTSIQVALETVEKKHPAEKVVIMDALNVLGVYNNKQTLGRFLHLFTNKMLLNGNTTIIFTVKEATDEGIISMAKEFSAKSYDFSEITLASITETP